MEPQRIIGIDENGLGPRLGPLVVTGVRLRLSGTPLTMTTLRAATRLDDSKRVFSPARRDRGEALALGVLAGGGERSLQDLLAERSVPVPWRPPADCPAADRALSGACPALALSRPLPRWAERAADLQPAFERLGVAVERVAFAVLCPGTLNVALSGDTTKLAVDLRLFETVAMRLLEGAQDVEEIVCGKVGGTDRYGERFAVWADYPVRPIVEGPERSTYQIRGVGRVSFLRDADATEPAVAIASVVGKYVRELWMGELASAAGWDGPAPSGYHDEATTRLIEHVRTAVAQGTWRLPAGCILRAR
jgi:ribonuclease HII